MYTREWLYFHKFDSMEQAVEILGQQRVDRLMYLYSQEMGAYDAIFKPQ